MNSIARRRIEFCLQAAFLQRKRENSVLRVDRRFSFSVQRMPSHDSDAVRRVCDLAWRVFVPTADHINQPLSSAVRRPRVEWRKLVVSVVALSPAAIQNPASREATAPRGGNREGFFGLVGREQPRPAWPAHRIHPRFQWAAIHKRFVDHEVPWLCRGSCSRGNRLGLCLKGLSRSPRCRGRLLVRLPAFAVGRAVEEVPGLGQLRQPRNGFL